MFIVSGHEGFIRAICPGSGSGWWISADADDEVPMLFVASGSQSATYGRKYCSRLSVYIRDALLSQRQQADFGHCLMDAALTQATEVK